VYNNKQLAAIGSSSAVTLSASEAIHRPLHEENLLGTNSAAANELSSLNGKYGGLYNPFNSQILEDTNNGNDDMLAVATNGNNVLGFQVDDFDQRIDVEQFHEKRDNIKINVSKRRGSRQQAEKQEEDEVPLWLPPIPAKSQILCLNVKELKLACAQRGLRRTGKKADLQKRLLVWAAKKEGERVKSRLVGLRELLDGSASQQQDEKTSGADSRKDRGDYTVEALTNRRKAINENSSKGNTKKGTLGLVDQSFFDKDTDELSDEDDSVPDDKVVTSESRAQLSRSFNKPTKYSNRDLREMYMQAKFADQNGDRPKCKSLLRQLRQATPTDMRVVRRLSRIELEDGNVTTARKLLQSGIRQCPNDAHLLHGLGQLERSCGNDSTARQYFQRATEKNPTFPNPYHALGTLEHSHGNIKMALAVIKRGIQNCPTNHRLHHALGDIYLDAQMLDLAEESYFSALQNVEQEWGKSFVYNSLSYVAYAKGNIEDCRNLLQQSLDINDMHAQGVIALAQLEESVSNINDARKVYRDAINRYEKKRMRRGAWPQRSPFIDRETDPFDSSSFLSNERQSSTSYAGDKWINVFRSWARMEETYGNYETAHIVFSRAVRLFPDSISLLTEWAKLQMENKEHKKGKLLLEAACQRACGRSVEPFKLFAEFEMRRRNFNDAQSILFRGAQSVAESSDSNVKGLADLYHTWGVCEYHLGNIDRAEQLFNDAIRVTGSGEADAKIRSLILYSMATLEYKRGEYLLAQHCVGLSMTENLLPGGNSRIWLLWADIARKMENEKLMNRCREQAFLLIEAEKGGTASDLSRIFEERASTCDTSPGRTGSAMKDMFRRTPWYSKICATGKIDKAWYDGARLWTL